MRQHIYRISEHPVFSISTLVLLIVGGLAAWMFLPASSPVAPGQSAAVGGLPMPWGKPSTSTPALPTDALPLFPYIEIVESCGPYYVGACVNMRSGPGEEYPSIAHLRNGVVLKVADTVTNENGEQWYRLMPDSELRYPERVTGEWYVSAEVAELFYDDGDHRIKDGEVASTTKHVVVDISEQKLYAYNGDGSLFMEQIVSTGLEFTPTVPGTYTVYKMTPSRYMQGPIIGVGFDYYDLPGVPWNLYFTTGGAVIHGAYWHDNFGQRWSHGCVNLPSEKAKDLYLWADLGTQVTVQD